MGRRKRIPACEARNFQHLSSILHWPENAGGYCRTYRQIQETLRKKDKIIHLDHYLYRKFVFHGYTLSPFGSPGGFFLHLFLGLNKLSRASFVKRSIWMERHFFVIPKNEGSRMPLTYRSDGKRDPSQARDDKRACPNSKLQTPLSVLSVAQW